MKKIRFFTLIFAGLLLFLILGVGAISAIDPGKGESISPLTSAGPMTRSLSSILPALFSSNTSWPSWTTDRDKENFARTVAALQKGESKKFIATLMVFQSDLEEKGHGVLELKRLLLSEIAGEVFASTLTPIVLGVFGAVTILLMSAVLSHAGLNPMTALDRMGGWLFGVAGSWLFRLVTGAVILTLMTMGGVGLSAYPNLLFGVTEVFGWAMVLYFLLLIATKAGLIKSFKEKRVPCPECRGVGSLRDPRPYFDAVEEKMQRA